MVALAVPVMSNFKGFTELMASVDIAIKPTVIDNWTENRGVAKAWNKAIADNMSEEVLIIANDDVVFWPGTLRKLVLAAYYVDLVSVVGSETGQYGLHYEGFPDYCCYAIKPKEFVEKFGTFDENFRPAYFEDNDMHYRMKLAGGESAMLLDARVTHVGSVTQNMGGDGNLDPRVVSHEQFVLNREYYIAKWGGEPGNERFKTPYNFDMSYKEWIR